VVQSLKPQVQSPVFKNSPSVKEHAFDEVMVAVSSFQVLSLHTLIAVGDVGASSGRAIFKLKYNQPELDPNVFDTFQLLYVGSQYK